MVDVSSLSIMARVWGVTAYVSAWYGALRSATVCHGTHHLGGSFDRVWVIDDCEERPAFSTRPPHVCS